MDDDDKDYEVEEVVDMKVEDSKKFYLIKWQGYPSWENTWEPEENLACHDLITEFDLKKELKVAEKKSISVA